MIMVKVSQPIKVAMFQPISLQNPVHLLSSYPQRVGIIGRQVINTEET